MTLRNVNRALILVLALGSVTISAADDEKKPANQPPAKLPDYSKYTSVIKEVMGEVVTVDEKKITLKVAVTQKKGAKGLILGEAQKELTYSFIEESLVRTSLLPLKLDEKGKKIAYKEKEKEALKLPTGAPGYAAKIDDLEVGGTVNLLLIRDKSIAQDKATDDDLRIKFAIIQPEKPLKGLQGVWHLDAIESSSKRTEYKEIKTMVLTIKNDQWALAFGKDTVKDNQFLMSFGPANGNVNRATIIIDSTKDPKLIELRNPAGPVIWSGLYKLENDTLTICRPLRLGGNRPTELKSSDDAILWVWRKSNDK